MPVRVTSLDDRRISLVLEGYSLAFANALRRLALSDVPSMAVDFALFYDNSTSIYDEIIAHRLGLTVLSSDEAIHKYRPPEECKGREPPAPDCYVELLLEVEHPEDAATGRYVKAGEIKTSDPLVKPVYEETPILYLAPGQKIHLIAYARLGRGREHAKWSPASVSILQYMPRVRILDSDLGEECRQCIQAYREILEAADKGESEVIYESNVNTSGLNYCASTVCAGKLSLEYAKDTYILTVESNGSLRPEKIVYEAARSLKDRANKLVQALAALRG
ncbi:MAG: DNA-directed RNA polymerase subunit D [Desulfurococcales archaeon]|nr:DNA-directed RNA polymerase subunit D [Desulfurococcales archaeon]